MREKAARKTREDVGNECHGHPIIYTAETIFPDGPGGVAMNSINACFFLCPVADSARGPRFVRRRHPTAPAAVLTLSF